MERFIQFLAAYRQRTVGNPTSISILKPLVTVSALDNRFGSNWTLLLKIHSVVHADSIKDKNLRNTYSASKEVSLRLAALCGISLRNSFHAPALDLHAIFTFKQLKVITTSALTNANLNTQSISQSNLSFILIAVWYSSVNQKEKNAE